MRPARKGVRASGPRSCDRRPDRAGPQPGDGLDQIPALDQDARREWLRCCVGRYLHWRREREAKCASLFSYSKGLSMFGVHCGGPAQADLQGRALAREQEHLGVEHGTLKGGRRVGHLCGSPRRRRTPVSSMRGASWSSCESSTDTFGRASPSRGRSSGHARGLRLAPEREVVTASCRSWTQTQSQPTLGLSRGA